MTYSFAPIQVLGEMASTTATEHSPLHEHEPGKQSVDVASDRVRVEADFFLDRRLNGQFVRMVAVTMAICFE